MKILLRRGPGDPPATGGVEGEIVFSTTRQALFVWNGDKWVRVANVLEGPDGFLYAKPHKDLIPIGIRDPRS